jgi:thiol:disulfide interchange protein DsbD
MKTAASIFACITIYCVAMASQPVAQKNDPVKWHFSAVQLGDKKARLIFTASIDRGWHIYSQSIAFSR